MKPWLIALVGAVTFLAVFFIIKLYLKGVEKSLQSKRRNKQRSITKSIGARANGAYILEAVDLVTQQFAYKLSVTNDGRFTTQVDFALVTSSGTTGPIATLSGDVAQNSTHPPSAGGSGYTDGTFNNITILNLRGSMNGSGALGTIVVIGGTVVTAIITSPGIEYSVGDVLKPCFTFSNSDGTQDDGCTSVGTGCELLVNTVRRGTVQNPALNDPVWAASTTVRDIGPGAQFAANETNSNGVNITYMGDTFSAYYPGFCGIGAITQSAQNQWFCLMDELFVVKDLLTRNSLRFNSMTILAKSSVVDDFRIYYLLHTCTGLGILAAPVGALITVDLFASGYNDLFIELGHPRCGQTAADLPLNGLPGLGIDYFHNFVCGLGCVIVQPPSQGAYDTLIWELASPNGIYRLQFFDSGHFRFARTAPTGGLVSVSVQSSANPYIGPILLYLTSITGTGTGAAVNIVLTNNIVTGITLVNAGTGYSPGDMLTSAQGGFTLKVITVNTVQDPPIFETLPLGSELTDPPQAMVNYPVCVVPNVTELLTPTKSLDIRRNGWILRGASYYYRNTGRVANIPSAELMVQITDAGNMVLQKDYRYGTDVQNSHVMNQSAIGTLDSRDPLLQNLGYTINDDKQMHFKLGNTLACFGGPVSLFGGQFDYDNGTILAQTDAFYDPIDSQNNGRYILWLSHYGLRLLFADYPSAQLLQDFTACMWITPMYAQWFYVNGDFTQPVNAASECTTNGFPSWPIPNVQANGSIPGSSTGGNININTCGTFRKPSSIKTPDGSAEVPIIVLSSKNKRYQFRMMSSGRCMLYDLNSTTPLFSTDNYNQVSNSSICNN